MNAPTMQAVIATAYGSPDVLRVQTIAKPIPKDHEILVKVYASTVTTADTMMRRADPFISRFFLGFSKPKNPVTGTGFAGVVESVGKAVKRFKTGDAIFGETGVNFSANAEYVCVPEDGVFTAKPANLSYEEAATMTDGPLTSLNFLHVIGQVKPGQKVLINGASGSLGTAAVQLAKYFGAEVTGVSSARNSALVKSLGADHIIDYTTTDFTQNGKHYDLIYDTVGKLSFSKVKNSLTQHGAYLSPKLGFGILFQMLRTSISGTRKAKFSATGLLPPPQLNEMLEELKTIIEGGHLKTIIEKRYLLSGAVEAHRHVETGRKKGNVVLTIVPES
jgi:NADPH:quinone reductase-like Zn-dependent oxidoreductase